MQNDYLLLFLDFEKAFDSVEYNFMFKTLEKFNFGDKFIGMIFGKCTVVNTLAISKILYNGYILENPKCDFLKLLLNLHITLFGKSEIELKEIL